MTKHYKIFYAHLNYFILAERAKGLLFPDKTSALKWIEINGIKDIEYSIIPVYKK